MSTRAWALSLDLFSNWMLLVSLVWGGASLWLTRRRFQRERATILRLHQESQSVPSQDRSEWYAAELRRAGVPSMTWGDILTRKQDVELTVIDYLRPTLKGPFLLAAGGAVLGVIAAALNLLEVA